MQKREVRPMTQPAKNRQARVWSMNTDRRESFLSGLKIEERVQAFWESRAGTSLRQGIPVLALCLFGGQGKLTGGAMPFAPALLAGAMMRGRAVPYAAAGCALGALIAGSPAMLLACALLFALYAALRLTNLKPNDLTCVLAAGLSAYLLPLLFAQNLYDHIMAAAGGLTAMVLSRMYATALRVRLQDRELLSPEEIISLSLLLAGVLTGFRQLAPWGISPVLAVLLFLCIGAGWLCGAGMGAAVGAVTGLMLGVTQPEAPYLLPGMVLSGLLPGLFARLGKWGAAAALPVALVLAGAMDARFLTWQRAVEGALACAGFLCVRESAWERLRAFVSREERVRRFAAMTQGGLRGEMREKIRQYAGLYGRMARSLSASGAGGPYAAVSAALRAMAEDLSTPVQDLPELSREIAQDLDAAHIRVEGVRAQRVGEACRVHLQVHCRQRDGLCDKRLRQVVSAAVGAPMRASRAGFCPKEGPCALTMEEAEAFAVDAGYASLAPDGGQDCGDTLTTVQLPDGQYMAALADGMGHGLRAQAESRAAIDLMEDFLLARFEPEAALSGVNDLLLHRDKEESFSTMDLMLIDLARGTLRAMKIGAVPSYIRRGRRLLSIAGDALPMGIVEKVRPSVTQLKMQDGDALILLSDGVMDAVDGNEKWLTEEILAMDLRDAEGAARRLISHARAVGKHEDDMTVCVLRLVRRHG